MEAKYDVDSEQSGRVADFYDGKSIFLTGASGFVGSVLLECLLRCCPGIQTIYILLRGKRGKSVAERKEIVLDKTIFSYLKRENPHAMRKIKVVPGDISKPMFGMTDEDYDMIADEVSIVFHCAASIALDKPLDFIVQRNTVSVDNVIQLCRKLKKLDVLVYTSTAYSNVNRSCMKECIYRLPFPAQAFIDALNKSKEELESLVAECQPPWPNTYTFSKCLAENLLVEKASDLPVAIVRPSVVMCTLKPPLPGYVEDSSGITSLALAVGKGFAKAVWITGDQQLNTVPADTVANAHVISAWIVGTGRSGGCFPFIVNCAKSGAVESISKFIRSMMPLYQNVILPNSFSRQTNYLLVTKHRLLYKMVAFVQHYIPAYVIDAILKSKGKKPKLVALYKVYDEILDSLFKVVEQNYKIECDTFDGLPRLLHPEDKEIFDTDLSLYSFKDIVRVVPSGAPMLSYDVDKRPREERTKIVNQRFWLMRAIKTTAILFFLATLYLLYNLVTRIFQTFLV